MPDATPDVVAIENYIAGVINQDASTVAEVAQVAAQTAVAMSNLKIVESVSQNDFLGQLVSYNQKVRTTYLIEFLTDLKTQYANSLLTPEEIFDEIISLLTGE